MSDDALTISDLIQQRLDELTRAERQLAHSILENYPASGLGPLTALAQDARVSVPTVARMVQKLGFKGYPEFQSALREELKAKVKNPIAKHDSWAGDAPSEHILNRFTDAVMTNIRLTLGQIKPADFDRASALIGDTERHVFIVGGRITHTVAEYLFLHMQVIRTDVTHIQTTASAWPHYLLNVGEGDVVVIFDMRRYENNTLKLAEMAQRKGAKLVLFTRIEAPAAWDSVSATLLLVETMIAAVQDPNWDATKDRMEELEGMFDRTKLFRKFT